MNPGCCQNLGMLVEFAKTTHNAMDRMGREKFQLVISDIHRGNQNTAGLDFMHEVQVQQMKVPMIFYVSQVDVAQGVPPGAFGITDDPNELIHLVLDVAERL